MTQGAPGEAEIGTYDAVARMRDPQAVRQIVEWVCAAPWDGALDSAATAALQGMGDTALGPLAEVASNRSGLAPGRDAVAFVMIGRLRTPAARDWLLSACPNGDPEVRRNAVVGLGELGDAGVVGRLEEIHEADPHDAVRAAALAALRKLGHAPPELSADDRARAPLTQWASQPLTPLKPPALDPRDLRILSSRSPATREQRVVDYCPECRLRTVQDRYTIIVGHWYGLKVPFTRPMTHGKLGKRAAFSSCAECGSLLPLDDDAAAFVARYGEPYLRAPGRSG